MDPTISLCDCPTQFLSANKPRPNTSNSNLDTHYVIVVVSWSESYADKSLIQDREIPMKNLKGQSEALLSEKRRVVDYVNESIQTSVFSLKKEKVLII
jgi:hypothetical protein